MIEEFEAKAETGVYAELMSDRPSFPAADVAALTHYRLVYESDNQKQVHEDAQSINDVKIFEYVPGARITGEGEIELELMTNTGRTFTYRQESVNEIGIESLRRPLSQLVLARLPNGDLLQDT